MAGSTGLVGRALVEALVESGGHNPVVALVRRDGTLGGVAAREQRVDFRDLESTGGTHPARDAFCCLGTTMAKAGSRDAFREVDFDAVMAFARWAHRQGASRFFFVSSMGANPGSPFFYSRVKGEAEAALAQEGFQSLVILRPGLLLGKRDESRPGEALAGVVGRFLSPLLLGPLKELKPVEGSAVAAFMAHLATTPSPPGVTILGNREILGEA